MSVIFLENDSHRWQGPFLQHPPPLPGHRKHWVLDGWCFRRGGDNTAGKARGCLLKRTLSEMSAVTGISGVHRGTCNHLFDFLPNPWVPSCNVWFWATLSLSLFKKNHYRSNNFHTYTYINIIFLLSTKNWAHTNQLIKNKIWFVLQKICKQKFRFGVVGAGWKNFIKSHLLL